MGLGGDIYGRLAAKIAVSAAIGGTASVLGGGKFQNGAVTGAFVAAFNGLREMIVGQLAHAAIAKDIADNNPEGVFRSEIYSADGARRADLLEDTTKTAYEIKRAGAGESRVFLSLKILRGVLAMILDIQRIGI